jgi:hypothetical protein
LKPWPGLLSFLPQLASSSDASHHVLCFFLIDKVGGRQVQYYGAFTFTRLILSVSGLLLVWGVY